MAPEASSSDWTSSVSARISAAATPGAARSPALGPATRAPSAAGPLAMPLWNARSPPGTHTGGCSADQHWPFERSRFRDHEPGFGLEPFLEQRAVHAAIVGGPDQVFVFIQLAQPGEFAHHFPRSSRADQERQPARAVVRAGAVFLGAPAELRPQLDHHPL